MTAKTGPLTLADLQGIWESVVDDSFWRPMEQAGVGNGFEAYQQAWAQFERVSQAVDTTTQAMFLLPWSGQSGSPAGGAKKATVTLTLTRSGLLSQPLILSAGTLVGELINDWGSPEGIQVQTGRLYALDVDLVFEPGQSGPLTVSATAQRPGYGYNNPQAGTISVVQQVGTKFANVDATVRGANYPLSVTSPNPITINQNVFLDAIDQSDAFLPDHVGQYVELTAGANVGRIARVVGWTPPDLAATPMTGGTLQLERTLSIVAFTGHVTGTFRAGEVCDVRAAGSYVATVRLQGLLAVATGTQMTFAIASGNPVSSSTTTITGRVSGAVATVDQVSVSYDFTPEAFAASWRILDWVVDWGVACTNVAQPSGGRAAMLDALAKERDLYRAAAEDDDHLRARASQIADVVSPNAIRRALNRAIPQLAWCLREAGQLNYPGFFFDQTAFDLDALAVGDAVTGRFLPNEPVLQVSGGLNATGRALTKLAAPATVPGPPSGPPVFVGVSGIWGTFVTGVPIRGLWSDATVTPTTFGGSGLRAADRFRVWFDYLRMRAWFYVGVPNIDGGDFGFAYDDHPRGAYDGAGFLDFYDGFPVSAAQTYLQVYAAVDKIRAGGVGFEMLQNDGPCP